MKNGDNRLKSVTMADIASALGISTVTVSNALSGKKGVSSKLRAEVLLKARELGYLTENDLIEASLPEIGQEGDIGIITPQRCINGSTYYWQLYQELIKQLKNFDRYAILDVISKADENDPHLPRIIENHLVSGLIMLGKPGVKLLGEISKWGLPIVFLDFTIRDFDFASITGDDYYDMYRMTSFLISHGHSNIAYVAGNIEELERDRYLGYCKAIAESEMDPVAPCSIEKALEIISSEKIDAFLCEDRALAQLLIKKLKDISVTVPDMVSVACFSEMKAENDADITCVCRDMVQMSRVAVDALRSKLAGEGKGLVGRISVGGKLIIGNTTRSRLV